MAKMIPTSIKKLDEHLNGGFPQGAIVLFSAAPAIDVDAFVMQAFYSTLLSGEKGVFLTTESTPERVMARFREFGWDLDRFKGSIAFVDSYSATMGQPSSADFVVNNVADPNEFAGKFSEAVAKVDRGGAKAIAFCSLSTILEQVGESGLDSYLSRLTKVCNEQGALGMFTLTDWGYDRDLMHRIEEKADAVIFLDVLEEKVVFGQTFSVKKAKWANAEQLKVMFKVIAPGGVKAFIPKILITGPFSSGKTSFVHALSTHSVSVERRLSEAEQHAEKASTTVALDYGHVERDGVTADIFGTPGQARFDPILPQLSGSSMGVLLIVDSTKPETFRRGFGMLGKTRKMGLPFIVVANKQDMKGALRPDEVRAKMGLPAEVPVLPCSATKAEGVGEAFKTLVDIVLAKKKEGK
jgi:small GTP-binding protein